MARDEATGLHAAYATAMDAYRRVDPEHRDSMFVGALCVELLRELGDPTCSYAVAGEFCGAPARWDASGRALCDVHAPIVDEARRRRGANRAG